MNNLVEFTKKNQSDFYRGKKFGIFYPIAKQLFYSFSRLCGNFSVEDQIKLTCMCEPPMFFLNYGLTIPHPYGITLSVDEIGCDVHVGQNVTIGTNSATNNKPRIGNLVRLYSNAVISGEIKIGNCVIVAASSIVTKDVPDKSIVYGINKVMPLQERHIGFLKAVLHHCAVVYKIVPGLMYKDRKMYINTDYIKKRNLLLESLENSHFADLLTELF